MKLKESLAGKIAAIILSYVMVLTLAISAIATVVMGYYKFYFSNCETVTQEILTDMAQNEAYYIESLLDKGTNLKSYYKDKNVYYEITDAQSKKVTDTNFSGQEYSVTASSEIFSYEDYYWQDEEGNEYYDMKEKLEAEINVYIAKDMTKNDVFSVAAKIIEIGFKLRFAMVFILLAALIALIVLLCHLYCAAGHRQGGVITRNHLDFIPFDILTAAAVFIVVMSFFVIDGLSRDLTSAVFSVFLCGTVDYFVVLGYTLSFATRVKTRTLIKNNLIYYILSFIGKYLKKLCGGIKYLFSNIPLVYKTVIVIAAVLVLEIIGIIIAMNTYWYWPELLVIGIILINIVAIGTALYLAVTLQKIKTGGERIAGGDLQYKIDTRYMYGDFREFCESLNNINLGLQSAVNEKMKSERFKTELITNVSHDIKTPLTSIISYVDLIKKEEPENETVRQYIDVLDRQSGRLKKLVEDLVEASKASTGNLPVNFAVCDVGVLLTQTLGEFEERLEKAEIYPILKQPEESVKIMADGRHLWRVFDNLMSNVCKYAQSGTRVYLDVEKQGGRAVITFRNISKYQLNVSSDELMERFVRGDSSRNTEGSGLGLSIAKSLIDLQKGSMKLSVDGDLFKVTIEFNTVV